MQLEGFIPQVPSLSASGPRPVIKGTAAFLFLLIYQLEDLSVYGSEKRVESILFSIRYFFLSKMDIYPF